MIVVQAYERMYFQNFRSAYCRPAPPPRSVLICRDIE